MNNLDSVLGLGKTDSTFLKTEKLPSVQEEKEKKNFEGVLENHWDENEYSKNNVLKSKSVGKKELKAKVGKKDEKEKDKDEEKDSSSNAEVKASDNKVEDSAENQKTAQAETEEKDSEDDQAVEGTKENESYLTLFLQELFQETPVPVVPPAVSLQDNPINLLPKISLEGQVEVAAQSLPLQTAKQNENGQELKNVSVQKEKGSESHENQKELSALLGGALAKTTAKDSVLKNQTDSASGNSTSTNEKVDLKKLLSPQERSRIVLDEDFSLELDQAAKDLHVESDKLSLTQTAALNLPKNTSNVAATASGSEAVEQTQKDYFKPEDVTSIHKQLIDRFQLSVKGKEDCAELHLSPPDWGRINIQMNVENKNELKVQMQVENPNVRQLLEQNTQELKQLMSSSGLGFSSINVGVGGEAPSSWKQKQELGEQDFSVDRVVKKATVVPKAYRWVNSQTSGVDQIV